MKLLTAALLLLVIAVLAHRSGRARDWAWREYEPGPEFV